MHEKLIVILIGMVGTSESIIKKLKDLDVRIKLIPVIDVDVDYNEVALIRRLFSSKFKPNLSVFTSKTAVKIVFNLIPEAWECAKSHAIAIGSGTASLLKTLNVQLVDLPTKHNSEGLIQLLKIFSRNNTIALYCSKEVNPILEEFIKKNFKNSYIFKLYGINESKNGVKYVSELIKSDPSKMYLIILTSFKIVQILPKIFHNLPLHNVIFSALSERIANEAKKLGFHISHLSNSDKIDDYYKSLREYVRTFK